MESEHRGRGTGRPPAGGLELGLDGLLAVRALGRGGGVGPPSPLGGRPGGGPAGPSGQLQRQPGGCSSPSDEDDVRPATLLRQDSLGDDEAAEEGGAEGWGRDEEGDGEAGSEACTPARRPAPAGGAGGANALAGSGQRSGAASPRRATAAATPPASPKRPPLSGPAPAQLCGEQQRSQGFVHRQLFEQASPPLPAPPRGQLVIDAGFEGGNVAAVRRAEDGQEYEITLRPDSLNPK
jgi:hypothetical protein